MRSTKPIRGDHLKSFSGLNRQRCGHTEEWPPFYEYFWVSQCGCLVPGVQGFSQPAKKASGTLSK